MNATSIQAHYLTLNSGDSILLDAAGRTLTATGSGATANFTAPNLITVNNADFSSFAMLKMASDTIALNHVTLALISNFDTANGGVNGPELAGGLTLINCRWQNTAITSASQITLSGGPGNTPGIYSY